MAPESLTEMMFSSQSDVWSFGVVLWELFSLGKVPYPGITVNQLIEDLKNGYRMDTPEFASNEIGQLIASCWKSSPNERPTFHQLQEMLNNQLEAAFNEHYLSINDPYIQVL